MDENLAPPTYDAAPLPSGRGSSAREFQAFKRLLPELLRTHLGQYVAIYQEQVIDTDSDPRALCRRVDEKLGVVSIHIGQVLAQHPIQRIPYVRELPRKELNSN
jgi:hypothetical protein